MAENPGPALAEAPFEEDPRYEFDAPKHYDFTRTSLGGSRASDWFFSRDCTMDGEPAAPRAIARALMRPDRAPLTVPYAGSQTPRPRRSSR